MSRSTTLVEQETKEAILRDGFCTVDDILSGDDLERIREIHDRWTSGEATSSKEHYAGGTFHQIFTPSEFEPFLANNSAIENAKKAVSGVLDDPFMLFDSMNCKAPGDPNYVPWHQDLAYEEAPFTPAGAMDPITILQLWIPLDDVDEANGCMHYLPGYHTKPLMPHKVVGGDPSDSRRLLAWEDSVPVDYDAVVPVRVKAGTGVIHTLTAPHFTPPNTTRDRQRRVYAFLLSAQSARSTNEAIAAEHNGR